MTFLRRFWTSCDAFLRRLVGQPVDRTQFTRFVYSRRHLRDPYNAFLPPANGELSVCQILGRSAATLWRIGSRVRRDQPLRGRADFDSAALPLVSPDLTVVVDHHGYRGHANMTGWPSDKPRRMNLAKRLAQRAEVHSIEGG
jgi:hypothetical protein